VLCFLGILICFAWWNLLMLALVNDAEIDWEISVSRIRVTC
jgi:hypothetical protein